MPELPEVEVVRQGLASRILGSRWQRLDIFDQRMLVTQSRSTEQHERLSWMDGGTVADVVRRGKYLWLVMRQGREQAACVLHLGMSGQLIHREFLPSPVDAPISVHERARWTLTSETHPGHIQTIGFIDQRMFGWIVWDELVPTPDGNPAGHGSNTFPTLPAWAVDGDVDWATRWYPQAVDGAESGAIVDTPTTALLPSRLQHVARDALDPWVDIDHIIATNHARQTPVKALLLDQAVVSGIGNIYAAEALWLAQIDPRRMVKRTSTRRLQRAYAAAAIVIAASLQSGGTTFDNQYRNVNGMSGSFFSSLMVYGRSGLPCRRCGAALREIRQSGRATVYCSICQH